MENVSNYFGIYIPRVSTLAHENHMQKRFAVQSSGTQITHFTEQYQGGRANIYKAPRTMPGIWLGHIIPNYH